MRQDDQLASMVITYLTVEEITFSLSFKKTGQAYKPTVMVNCIYGVMFCSQ